MFTFHPKNQAQLTPNKAAYVIPEDNVTVTYEELDHRSNQIAHTFRKLGLKAGDSVALLVENRQGFFELCWAAQRAGLHYTPISTHLKADEIIYIVKNCDAQAFVLSERYRKMAPTIAKRSRKSTRLLSLGAELDSYEELESLMECSPITPIDDETAGSSMLYSSGTTGHPKGIKHLLSGRKPDYCPPRQKQFKERYQLDNQTVYLSPAPLYHAAPLGFTMATMAFGGTCIVMKRFDPELSLKLIERYAVTHSQWVPTMFVRLLRLEKTLRQKYDLCSHRIAIHAAAPCPIETKKEMISWWGPIVQEFYSGSEGVGTTFITAEEWLKHPGSVGRSVDGNLHIVGEDGNELPAGEIGTIYFENSPHFEYYNQPDKTEQALTSKGWGTLGDVGYVDDEGYLFLTDRKANMIISGGVNIYPQEAENILLSHQAVLDAAVFGIPDEEFGETVKAVVELTADQTPNSGLEQELLAFCNSRIASIKCPRSIDFEHKLPRLPNGKLYKRELKARYWPKQ